MAARRGVLASLGLFVASAVAFLFMTAGAELACLECNCTYRLFDGPWRCRWPALWAYVTVGLFLCSVGAAGLAALRRLRTRPRRSS